MKQNKKRIKELKIEDIQNIAVWDKDGELIQPFFFDPNQEVLTPLHHDVIPAEFYVRSTLYKDSQKYIAICKYSKELFYNLNDYESLDIWFFKHKIKKLDYKDLPVYLEINLNTYPFFNNYLIITYGYDDLPKMGKNLLKIINKFNRLNILLTGDLGSGKTTFLKNVINTNSPSFNIMNSFKLHNDESNYNNCNQKIINHWDLYRIETNQDNLNDIDFWFHLNQENTINFIEWANKIKLEYYLSNSPKENLLCFNFSFIENEDKYRILTISSFFKILMKDFQTLLV
ncbi:MAG: tRNA (adenosine(37)-N6)-threonylcarbamoyltransferase complex ATPase subunit type 1 TsaE [Candidatus Calescibacterium sp.]|nr:tRNA (adenosine(37)-N6)-threonylcarbamoyltransferase complex ATPase subunit type 1 TsaE [Candidatus Calescibacterium sp.]MDW8133201.1 tRNA (adenosine(37)-N6)-threonylcarbamoyltransferase complex ATPase subunit type 1 TsaE [Candidatus Calescibacterium sp.]